jgi:hypothetical protein
MLKDHEPQCKAEHNPEKARAQQHKKRRKLDANKS